jgi:hypothetical protein
MTSLADQLQTALDRHEQARQETAQTVADAYAAPVDQRTGAQK